MSETKKASPIPNVRRVITGHNAEGKSIVLRDDTQPPRYWDTESVNPIYDIFRSEVVPASIDSEITTGTFVDEIASKAEHVNPTGSVFRSFEFSPGAITVRRVCLVYLCRVINRSISIAIPSYGVAGLRYRR
jgi:hypothetical protein